MYGLDRLSLSTIRVRLIAALAAALLPVLILGALQSAIGFQREGQALRQNLGFAAERSAATARARMEAADVLLQTLAPGAVGFQCAQRLADVKERIPGYLNLVRFDRLGRVVCAAGGVPADPQREARSWFRELVGGREFVITRDPGSSYADEPAVLTAARATRYDGAFDGAFAAVVALSSLQPQVTDPSLPRGAEVGLVEKTGRYISTTDVHAFRGCRPTGGPRSTPPAPWSGTAATVGTAAGSTPQRRSSATRSMWCCRPSRRASCPGRGSTRSPASSSRC